MHKVRVRFGDNRISRKDWDRIQRKVNIKKLGECWEWTAGLNGEGYVILLRDGRHQRGHRFFYETLVGAIPEKLDLDHLCRVRHCINPRHTEPVTRRTNILRGDGVAAKRAKITHCPNGHEYTPENTLRKKNNSRICRECNRIYCSRRRAKLITRKEM